ncbi:MAG: hypothetical protein VB084_02020 [Syntrophomonadaceae bacterium]|nr:hypothetical protein [Syntrophomonadaceae bacterium]
MQIIREAENYIGDERPLFLALGNFDGVHLGHKELILQLVEHAHIYQGKAAAFIFDPHPASILTPNKAPRMLVTKERKAELLQQLGLDLLIFHSFSCKVAHWSPEEFIKRILVDCLEVNEVYVGFNYSFGFKGVGTPEMLRTLGEKYRFQTHIIPPVTLAAEVISSSSIRICLEQGDIHKACRMLGYCAV